MNLSKVRYFMNEKFKQISGLSREAEEQKLAEQRDDYHAGQADHRAWQGFKDQSDNHADEDGEEVPGVGFESGWCGHQQQQHGNEYRQSKHDSFLFTRRRRCDFWGFSYS